MSPGAPASIDQPASKHDEVFVYCIHTVQSYIYDVLNWSESMFHGSFPDNIDSIDVDCTNFMVCITFQGMHDTASMACMDHSPVQRVLFLCLVFSSNEQNIQVMISQQYIIVGMPFSHVPDISCASWQCVLWFPKMERFH